MTPDPRLSADPISERVGRAAFRALLREVSAAPKPGLVDRRGNGSHSDMDFMTFADSALALRPAFVSCARAGFIRGREDPGFRSFSDGSVLCELRRIGVEAEVAMFAATGGANTHKGALFMLGLLAAAAGALFGSRSTGCYGPDPGASADGETDGKADGAGLGFGDLCRVLAARIARGTAAAELPSAESHGAAAYRSYGLRGIRGEVESGLASLDGGVLASLRSAPRPIGDAACVDALLSIMVVAEDTTLVHRGGLEALEFARTGAAAVLASGASRTDEGRADLALFCEEMVARRLSPGGSADLLAAGLFLVDLEEFSDRIERSMKSKERAILAVSA